jgi:hypothetical protein
MWTGNKEGSIYTAQISTYNKKVNAEILCKDNDFHESRLNLWLCVMHKSFSPRWGKELTEKEWIAASKWVEEQLGLVEKHGTVLVTKPNFLRDLK